MRRIFVVLLIVFSFCAVQTAYCAEEGKAQPAVDKKPAVGRTIDTEGPDDAEERAIGDEGSGVDSGHLTRSFDSYDEDSGLPDTVPSDKEGEV